MSTEELSGFDFKYQSKRDIETFKRVIKSDRIDAFPYLAEKNIEAFKLVEYDYQAFPYLDVKNIEAFKLVSEYNRYKVFQYLDLKNL